MIAALTGFMASGKTTFGRAAAELLGWRFADLDEAIAARYGTPAGIFASCGEERFRIIESQVLDEVLHAEAGTVLALGGGTILRDENLCMIRQRATLIWLDTSFEIIMSELGNADRPLIRKKSIDGIRALYDERRPLYEAAADIRFPINSSDYEEVIRRLADTIKKLS